MGLLTDGGGGGGLVGGQKGHTYPTMIKLGTVIPHLRKIQKMHESRDTSLEFC